MPFVVRSLNDQICNWNVVENCSSCYSQILLYYPDIKPTGLNHTFGFATWKCVVCNTTNYWPQPGKQSDFSFKEYRILSQASSTNPQLLKEFPRSSLARFIERLEYEISHLEAPHLAWRPEAKEWFEKCLKWAKQIEMGDDQAYAPETKP